MHRGRSFLGCAEVHVISFHTNDRVIKYHVNDLESCSPSASAAGPVWEIVRSPALVCEKTDRT